MKANRLIMFFSVVSICATVACNPHAAEVILSNDNSIIDFKAYAESASRGIDTIDVTYRESERTFALTTRAVYAGDEPVDIKAVHLDVTVAPKAKTYFTADDTFDLSKPQIISVYAEDNSFRDYAVSLTVAPDIVKRVKDYELSYWIDMDVMGKHMRGYWYDYSISGAETPTPESFVQYACKSLSQTYGANKLYVIYHRQYELSVAKTVFGFWQKWGEEYGLTIVPTVVPQNYAASESLNFTNEELTDLILWCKANVNADDFGLYDVYTRDRSGSLQDGQINAISNAIGYVLVKVCMQPGIALRPFYKYAVQDTWYAESQGCTNELWENPVNWNNSTFYGRNLLVSWVDERAKGSDDRKFVWNLIPVAWDYDDLAGNPYSYACPGDNALTNDPPVPDRVALCEQYIANRYTDGYFNDRFGGLSCDLHILQANSAGCGRDALTFYAALRSDRIYEGYFASAIDEIGEIYKRVYKNN